MTRSRPRIRPLLLALLLGMLAFFGEFVPVIGPWLAYLPTALIVMTGEPSTAFITLVVVSLFYLVVQMIENYIIVPKLMVFGSTPIPT